MSKYIDTDVALQTWEEKDFIKLYSQEAKAKGMLALVPAADVISVDYAIEILKAIKYGLWEIDIPSPTVPEYIEHHKQIQEMMGVVDNWIEEVKEYNHE